MARFITNGRTMPVRRGGGRYAIREGVAGERNTQAINIEFEMKRQGPPSAVTKYSIKEKMLDTATERRPDASYQVIDISTVVRTTPSLYNIAAAQETAPERG